MNVTLSIDEETLSRARELADRRGTSVEELIQDYLTTLASSLSSEEMLEELTQLWSTSSGDSRGRAWTREELHERAGLH